MIVKAYQIGISADRGAERAALGRSAHVDADASPFFS